MKLSGNTLIPIDAAARNGCYQLVFGGDAQFACVRWNGECWVFSSNHPLDFMPERYAPSLVIRHG